MSLGASPPESKAFTKGSQTIQGNLSLLWGLIAVVYPHRGCGAGPQVSRFIFCLLHMTAQTGLASFQPPGQARLHSGCPGRPVHTPPGQLDLSILWLHGQA